MSKMDEYDKFLNSVREKLIFKKSFKLIFSKLSAQSNSNVTTPKNIEKGFRDKENTFFELIKQLKAEGTSQEELDMLIEIHRQKSTQAQDEELNNFSIVYKNIQLNKILNKLSVNNGKKDNSRKFIVEFVEPTKTEIKNNVVKLPQKIASKWHALHYLFELEAKGLKIPVSREGSFIKTELEEIGRRRVGGTGQSFYRLVLKFKDDIKDSSKLEKFFGKEWKEIMIDTFKDDELLINYLNTRY